MNEAITLEQAVTFLKTQKVERENQCKEEVFAILQKYRCDIVVPMTTYTKDGRVVHQIAIEAKE